jgi:hypothetical protein
MKTKPGIAIIVLTAFSLFFGGMWLDEGMWLLDTVDKLPLHDMKNHGLELTHRDIYNPDGPSLTDAIVLLPGGTGGFISNEGLIVTNHHIAFAGIQALSSVHDDYLQNGFVARSRDEELSTSYSAEIVRVITDITDEVHTAINDGMTPDERAKALQERLREIQNTAKAGNAGYTYRTSEMYNGVKYYLFGYETLRDVRLVFAPPGSIGNFGGEVDNWTWPRHTGDFALMRAYVSPEGKPAPYAKENIPYTPRVFLPVSVEGAVESTFAMVMGFPGRTFRYREAAAIRLAHDETLPASIAAFKARIDAIERMSKNNRELEIKYATKLRRVANTYKNYIGTLEGMRRSDLLALKDREARGFAEFVAASPERNERYGTLLAEMHDATDGLRNISRKSVFLSSVAMGVDAMALANRFTTYAGTLPTDEKGKSVEPGEKEREAVRRTFPSAFKDFDVRVDKEILVALMLASEDLPAGQQIQVFREVIGRRTGLERERRVREFVDELYDETLLTTPQGCEELLMKSTSRIKRDPFIRFALKLAEEHAPVTETVTAYNRLIAQLRSRYMEAMLLWKQDHLLYPDANRTLRMTYGLVESLNPRDAVHLSHITTLTGVMEKESDEEPFIVPAKLKELWRMKDFGQYAEPKSGDVPVAFIANLDITGGNSGSPVINGRGELIGCAFDGNWEAVVADYHFEHRYNRSINVDSRYMLFIIDKFAGARHLLHELVIR